MKIHAWHPHNPTYDRLTQSHPHCSRKNIRALNTALWPMSTTLTVDGREIPLNEFVESFLENTISGSLQSLRGIGDWREVNITIKKD